MIPFETVAIFFAASVALALAPGPDNIFVLTQSALHGRKAGLFIISTLLIFGIIAWSAGFLGEWLKRSVKAQLIMNRVAGTVFTGLALRLAISER